MPKAGLAYPVSPEWKEAVRLRLKAKGWSLARLAAEVEATRATISHLLSKGVQSTLVPRIEEVLGWKPGAQEWKQIQGSLRPGVKELDLLKKIFGAADQMELISYFQDLTQENRTKVLERARYLWEEQEKAKLDGN